MASLRPSSRSSLAPPSLEVVRELCDFLTRSTGITADSQRQARMLLKLEKRIQELGLPGWEEYCALLTSSQEEFLAFAVIMTVNKTHFFREEQHFRIIQEHAKKHQGKFLCWSAACSTGEEVYTLAMSLHATGIDFGVLGSDINRRVLEQAEAGIYSEEAVTQEVPIAWQRRYFWRGIGSQAGLYRVNEELRLRTKFRLINLVRPDQGPAVRFHAVFLRNVLIYFSPQTQKDVLMNICRHLQPSGLLFLGHCERLPEPLPELEALGSAVYRYLGSA